MNSTLLELAQVGIHFGALKAVDGVDLTIAPGERCAILGPNGAGKTTLFNAITGMIPASCGRVALAGADITRMAPNLRAARGIARTFQITNLFFGLSVEDNLLLAARGLGRTKFSLFGAGRARDDERQRVADALDKCHLHQRRSQLVKELSYGEQRQLELAMSLTSAPRLLLLDEPAAGLSPAERVVMADVIRGLPRTLSVILIEHDIDLALGLVDRVVCMYQGRVLVEGTPAEIRRNPQVQEIYLGRPRHA
ncbi:MAG TPA: ABC transporter ATP-binding protein [Paraburkholderia sp.]|jgi:branched-chain amino acid transport system ATP-binding protein|nr:ABC transporter ATP-binding protein [Paraburkholderia sp.]